MTAKTITLTGAETRAVYSGGSNAWLRNDGTDVIYAAAVPGITAGSDGVVSIPAGQSAPVYGAYGTVYLLGTGSVQLIGSDYSTNPFKTSAQSGGSGADSVARAAITAHAGNTEIHVTAAQKSVWDGLSNPNLLINPDFAINQRGGSTYESSGHAVDGWAMSIIGSGNSGSYNAETHILSGSVLDKNGYYVNMFQFVEEPMRFAGKTLTLSAGMSELDKFALIQIWRTEGTTVTDVAATPYNLEADKVLTFTMPSDLTEASKIRVVLQTRGSVKLDWAKLELGSAATPFVPPDPATELLRCQRYYQRLHGVNAIFANGFLGGATIAYTIIPIAAMRTKPTLTLSGNAYIWAAGHTGANSYKATAAALDNYAGGNAIGVEFTLDSESDAVGQGCTVQFRDNESYIELNAEL